MELPKQKRIFSKHNTKNWDWNFQKFQLTPLCFFKSYIDFVFGNSTLRFYALNWFSTVFFFALHVAGCCFCSSRFIVLIVPIYQMQHWGHTDVQSQAKLYEKQDPGVAPTQPFGKTKTKHWFWFSGNMIHSKSCLATNGNCEERTTSQMIYWIQDNRSLDRISQSLGIYT